MTVGSSPAAFQYPRLTQFTVDLPLLVVALFLFFANAIAREGRSVMAGLTFCGLGAAFFTLVWYARRRSIVTLTVDERGLQSTAFWGLSRRSLGWAEVERVEYDTLVDRKHGYTGPKTYSFTRRNQLRRFGLRPACISFSEKIVGYSMLVAIVERKSVEYGFPIEPLS